MCQFFILTEITFDVINTKVPPIQIEKSFYQRESLKNYLTSAKPFSVFYGLAEVYA